MFWIRLSLEACAAAALAAVVYHYVGYPLLLRLAAALGRAPAQPAPLPVLPALSVIIPCHNEAEILPAKLDDLRAADYPADKIEIIVVSDGSSDETEAAARGADGVRVVAWPERRGKPAALNAGVAAASGEVLVFTDANAGIPPGSLRELVAPFADPRVGAVCGEQVITRGASSERAYWRWEARIKEWEAAVGSAVGADGSLYAVKRGLFKRVPEGRLIMDDFFVSLEVVAAGFRLAYAPAAVAREEALDDGRGSYFRTKYCVGSARPSWPWRWRLRPEPPSRAASSAPSCWRRSCCFTARRRRVGSGAGAGRRCCFARPIPSRWRTRRWLTVGCGISSAEARPRGKSCADGVGR
jgi:cellulose synthase/poly-beta-1,6-N-acetylglucosamine synthase-like glycosyltransferase